MSDQLASRSRQPRHTWCICQISSLREVDNQDIRGAYVRSARFEKSTTKTYVVHMSDQLASRSRQPRHTWCICQISSLREVDNQDIRGAYVRSARFEKSTTKTYVVHMSDQLASRSRQPRHTWCICQISSLREVDNQDIRGAYVRSARFEKSTTKTYVVHMSDQLASRSRQPRHTWCICQISSLREVDNQDIRGAYVRSARFEKSTTKTYVVHMSDQLASRSRQPRHTWCICQISSLREVDNQDIRGAYVRSARFEKSTTKTYVVHMSDQLASRSRQPRHTWCICQISSLREVDNQDIRGAYVRSARFEKSTTKTYVVHMSDQLASRSRQPRHTWCICQISSLREVDNQDIRGAYVRSARFEKSTTKTYVVHMSDQLASRSRQPRHTWCICQISSLREVDNQDIRGAYVRSARFEKSTTKTYVVHMSDQLASRSRQPRHTWCICQISSLREVDNQDIRGAYVRSARFEKSTTKTYVVHMSDQLASRSRQPRHTWCICQISSLREVDNQDIRGAYVRSARFEKSTTKTYVVHMSDQLASRSRQPRHTWCICQISSLREVDNQDIRGAYVRSARFEKSTTKTYVVHMSDQLASRSRQPRHTWCICQISSLREVDNQDIRGAYVRSARFEKSTTKTYVVHMSDQLASRSRQPRHTWCICQISSLREVDNQDIRGAYVRSARFEKSTTKTYVVHMSDQLASRSRQPRHTWCICQISSLREVDNQDIRGAYVRSARFEKSTTKTYVVHMSDQLASRSRQPRHTWCICQISSLREVDNQDIRGAYVRSARFEKSTTKTYVVHMSDQLASRSRQPRHTWCICQISSLREVDNQDIRGAYVRSARFEKSTTKTYVVHMSDQLASRSRQPRHTWCICQISSLREVDNQDIRGAYVRSARFEKSTTKTYVVHMSDQLASRSRQPRHTWCICQISSLREVDNQDIRGAYVRSARFEKSTTKTYVVHMSDQLALRSRQPRHTWCICQISSL